MHHIAIARGSGLRPSDFIDAMVAGLPSSMRGGRWLMLLQGYFDDSGSEPNSPVFVLGGLVSTVDRWKEFSDEWLAICRQEPSIDYFKMSEAHSGTGQFQGWPAPLRDKKILDLAAVIKKHAMAQVDCALRRVDFDDFIALFSPTPEFRDPYFLCFYRVVMSVNSYHKRHHSTAECDFIFDDQGSIGKTAVMWWDWLKALVSEERRSLLGSPPSFKDDKRVLPLQAADMYAWLARERIVKRRDTSIRSKAVLKALRHVHLIRRHLRRSDLMELGAGFVVLNAERRRRQPIR
jgi:hypothetical protein